MWWLLEVKDLMYGEGATLAKTFTTITALERLLLGMYVSVIPQMILSPKSLSTHSAWIRSLVRVCSLMYEQVVAFGKFSIAIFANKSFLGTSRAAWTSEQTRIIRGRAGV